MIVGAWNTQRASNLDSDNIATSARAGLGYAEILTWMSAPGAQIPSLVFLSEVTQSGRGLAARLTYDFDIGSSHTAHFYGTRDANNNTSPCSFILIIADHLGVNERTDVSLHGATSRRPYLKVRLRRYGWTFAGVHIVANRENSFDEILEMLDDLTVSEQNDVCLIGDMNYNFGDLTPQQEAELAQLHFTAYDPGLQRTFVSRGRDPSTSTDKIDFAIVSSNIASVRAENLLNSNYSDWTTIDHAPIFYDVPVNGDVAMVEQRNRATQFRQKGHVSFIPSRP